MRAKRHNPFTFAAIVHLLFCAALLLSFSGCPGATPAYAAEIITVEYVETVQDTQDFTPQAVEIPATTCASARSVEAIVLAQMVWGEARGCSTVEQAAVVWCALNRVDAGYGDLISVVTEPMQFVGYDPDNPIDPDILLLVEDVLDRRWLEDTNSGEVGRVLPADYLWFHGDGVNNYFRNAYEGGNTWDWSLPSPYGEGWSD